MNKNILKEICLDLNILYFDLVFIDGDHTAEGIQNDFEVISEFANRDTLIVIDNIWDSRLIEVKKFLISKIILNGTLKSLTINTLAKNKVQVF